MTADHNELETKKIEVQAVHESTLLGLFTQCNERIDEEQSELDVFREHQTETEENQSEELA